MQNNITGSEGKQMYLAIIVIQLLVSVVVGVYFLRAMRKENGENPTAAADSPESAAG